MPSLSNAAAFVVSFGIQTFLVFAGNSRFFGRLKEGSGWRTNVEMSVLYTSFVTPANYAFGIWGIIYTFELVAVCVLCCCCCTRSAKKFYWWQNEALNSTSTSTQMDGLHLRSAQVEDSLARPPDSLRYARRKT